jgi:hypothetical protein
MGEIIKGVKGFNKDLKCRDFQYEIGKEYEHKGQVKACNSGFHFVENPLDVFGYYPPADSRYCEVEGSGDTDKDGDDSKVACQRIKIGAEIKIPGIISAGVKFILDRVNWKDNKESNDANRSAATNTGYQSAATNTGDRSAASVEGKESIAFAMGYQSKAKGAINCWIVLAEWFRDDNYNWHIKTVKTAKVDGKKIKADTFYMLVDGKLVEADKVDID